MRRLARLGLALAAPVLIGGSLALAAVPASAAPIFVDNSLQANPPFSEDNIQAGQPSGVIAPFFVPVSCPGSSFTNNQPISVSPTGPQGGTTSTTGITAAFASATDCNVGGNLNFTSTGTLVDGTYTWEVSVTPNPSHNATEVAVVHVIVLGSVIDAVWTENVTVTTPPNTVLPNIQFTGKDSLFCLGFDGNQGDVGEPVDPCGYGPNPFPAINTTSATPVVTSLDGTWSRESLPGSLGFSTPTSGLLVPGGSGCASSMCTYNFATINGMEGGATASETFTLTVLTKEVSPPPGNSGDYVNPFGNGIDVFQQHYVSNTLIVGWTATQHDPATHFIRLVNVNGGFSLEAVRPTGIASGLCVSNPVGSEPPGFVAGQLTLRGCNGSQFQGFSQPGGDGTALFSDVAGTGHVEPNGTGNPLVVKLAFDGWGGFKYTWTQLSDLPA